MKGPGGYGWSASGWACAGVAWRAWPGMLATIQPTPQTISVNAMTAMSSWFGVTLPARLMYFAAVRSRIRTVGTAIAVASASVIGAMPRVMFELARPRP